MTIFYPDISSYQSGIALGGLLAVAAKATEGTGYVNPDYGPAKARAAKAGAFFCAYHFLHGGGSAAAQAAHAHSVAGGTPLMIDAEASAPPPGINDIAEFAAAYRALGGVVYLLYLPRWYWNNLGQPSLFRLSELGLVLVSSEYGIGYSDTGAGWLAYGGMVPAVWQYTSSATLHGVTGVDFNAYRGTAADFRSLASTGALGGPEPVLQLGDTGAAVAALQARLNAWGAKLTVDGVYGAATWSAVKAFQQAHQLTADGVAGPKTWAALDQPPPSPGPQPYPAPGGLAVSSVSIALTWAPVVIGGKTVESYTVQAVGRNGQVYAHETPPANSAVLAGLVPGWTYSILVWANGGPAAPPHASITITV